MRTKPKQVKYIFLLQWVFATAIGAAIGRNLCLFTGLAAIALLGSVLGVFGLQINLGVFGMTLSVFPFAGFTVGAIVGAMQRIVLRQRIGDDLSKPWVMMSTLGGGLGGAISGIAVPLIPIAWTYFIPAVAGLFAGLGLAIMQWLQLRKWVDHARWWLLVNALCWAVNEVVLFYRAVNGESKIAVFLGLSIGADFSLQGMAISLASGAIVGLGTGLTLLWLLLHPRQEFYIEED
jgi:hypothetical protein